MQRQTESTLNMSENTFTTSGPARKAKNCFLFCFLKNLHCTGCGLCPSSLKWGQIQENSIERRHHAYKSGGSSRPERFCKYPRSGRLPAELAPSREGRAEGRHHCHRQGHFTSVWGQVYSKLPWGWQCWPWVTPSAVQTPQTARSAAHMVGASINLGPQIRQGFMEPSCGLLWSCPGLALPSCCLMQMCQNRLIDILL